MLADEAALTADIFGYALMSPRPSTTLADSGQG
jgi:hypothetical protein